MLCLKACEKASISFHFLATFCHQDGTKHISTTIWDHGSQESLPHDKSAILCWHIFSLRYQQMAGCFSSWLKFGLSLPLTLRSASYSRSGSNWWILLVLGTQFLVLTASIAFEKCLTWHIFVSVFCNVEIFWHGSSSLLFSILQYYCLFCLIIFISFCLYGIIMTTIFSFFKPHILCSME